MDLGLSGRTALVLGAAGGLGSAIARTLAKEGTNVALADVDGEGLSKLSESLVLAGVRSLPLAWDMSDLGSIAGHMDSIERTLGPVDILVIITGGLPPTPARQQDPNVWARNFQSMVLSVIAITDRSLPNMEAGAVGPHYHQHVFRSDRANSQSGDFERPQGLARWLVEDPLA